MKLSEIIYQDLKIYQQSSASEIQTRIGNEIPLRRIKDFLYKMVEAKILISIGKLRWTKYSINTKSIK